MNDSGKTKTVEVEREYPHPAERVWRALTERELLENWLMTSDFELSPGHEFQFTAEWGSVDCRILEIVPEELLSYSWEAHGLESVVTWTLTRTDSGTLVRMQQSGFRVDQKQAYQGASHGWPRFLDNLAGVLTSIA